jgi:hypothetical protein
MEDDQTKNNVVPMSQGKNAFEAYAEAMTPTVFKGQLLRLNKMGKYKAGQEGIEVPNGTKMIVGVQLLKTGWVRWFENKPQESRMGLLNEGFTPLPRQALGDTEEEFWEVDDNGTPRDPWQFTNYLPMMDADTCDLYTFTTAAKGGLGAIGQLSGVYGRNIRIAPRKLPVIKLDYTTYMHPNKQFGEIAKPKFVPVIGWTDEIPEELASWDEGGASAIEHEERQAAIASPQIAQGPVAPAAAAPARPAPKVVHRQTAIVKGRKKVRFS